jgi:uncharacterized membrane protein YhfC
LETCALQAINFLIISTSIELIIQIFGVADWLSRHLEVSCMVFIGHARCFRYEPVWAFDRN